MGGKVKPFALTCEFPHTLHRLELLLRHKSFLTSVLVLALCDDVIQLSHNPCILRAPVLHFMPLVTALAVTEGPGVDVVRPLYYKSIMK